MSINHGNSKDQNARKWSYYRLKTEGHNTLTISSRKQTPLAYANQNVLAKSKVTKFESSPAKTFALTDLTQAYQSITGDDRQVTKAQRGIMLLGNQQLLVQDEVEATVPVDIIWNFHTRPDQYQR